MQLSVLLVSFTPTLRFTTQPDALAESSSRHFLEYPQQVGWLVYVLCVGLCIVYVLYVAAVDRWYPVIVYLVGWVVVVQLCKLQWLRSPPAPHLVLTLHPAPPVPAPAPPHSRTCSCPHTTQTHKHPHKHTNTTPTYTVVSAVGVAAGVDQQG